MKIVFGPIDDAREADFDEQIGQSTAPERVIGRGGRWDEPKREWVLAECGIDFLRSLRPAILLLSGEQTRWPGLPVQLFPRWEQAESLTQKQHKSATTESA